MFAHLEDLYDAEIRTLDDAIRDFVGDLGKEGLLDDTILVITADHGENLGDHGLLDHVFSLHRSICHVPLLIRFPPRFRAGARIDRLVRLEDVAPTLLDLCGLRAPEKMDGRSLLADGPPEVSFGFLDPPVTWLERMAGDYKGFDPVPLEFTVRSFPDGVHHLIRYSDGRVELYDLRTDPAETVNLAPRKGAVLERLEKRLEEEK
jgi:arylsulfatase A-like enzyme